MKIERKYLAHFINAGTEAEPVYERLGKELEEYAPELSAQVDVKKNILGQTSVLISGFPTVPAAAGDHRRRPGAGSAEDPGGGGKALGQG